MIWKNFKDKKESPYRLALSYDANEIVVVAVRSYLENKLPVLSFFKRYPLDAKEKIQSELKANAFDFAPATLILQNGYQMTLVDLPEHIVIEDVSQLQRHVADHVDYVTSDMILDYIELPSKKKPGSTKKYYLVSTLKNKLMDLVDETKKLGFSINNIQIIESVLSAIAIRLEDCQEGVIFIYHSNPRTYIILAKDAIIHMIRGIEMGPCDSNHFARDLGEEVQRTLDYCNASISKFNSNRIVLASSFSIPEGLLSTLSNALGLPGRKLLLKELFALEKSKDVSDPFIFMMLGALLMAQDPP